MAAMLCKLCGRENSAESIYCEGCGAELAPSEENGTVMREPSGKKLKSHMTAAVLTTIFFANWIFGIPAIVFARECEIAALGGQDEIAERFSRRALTFICVGSALSLAFWSFAVLAVTAFLKMSM